jgi:hypothetical protein
MILIQINPRICTETWVRGRTVEEFQCCSCVQCGRQKERFNMKFNYIVKTVKSLHVHSWLRGIGWFEERLNLKITTQSWDGKWRR